MFYMIKSWMYLLGDLFFSLLFFKANNKMLIN